MRNLALCVMACGVAAISFAAQAQQDAPASVDEYVCAFSGECAEEEAAEDAADGANAGRPRISADRSFSLGGRDSARTPPRQRATDRRANRPARPRDRQVAAAPRRPAGPGQRVNLRLTFETGSANLTAGARAQAQVFAQSLLRPQLRNMRFLIEGHTDSVGTRVRNLDLSQRRAQTVADFLIAAGVTGDRLVVRGFGPDRPLSGMPASASENRRVEAVRIS